MPRTTPTGLLAELQRKFSRQQRIHLFDVQTADGQLYYWSTHAGIFPVALGAGTATYKPWIREVSKFTLTRSTRSDAGEFTLQNLSGNTIEREVAKLVAAREFEGAYCIYRRWYRPFDDAAFSFHGFLTATSVDISNVAFRIVQLLNPGGQTAHDVLQTRACHWRFGSAQCGYRRGQLFVPLTTADIFSASTIGRASLALEPNLYKDEVAMILAGTGAGQERYIASHTATTFTLKTNWTTNPDGTSQFIITGPGTMLVSPLTADIHTSTTIGKTGAGWTADAYLGQSVMIVAGTGAGQRRKISTNSTTTLTVSVAWTTVPDGTSIFIVVYRTCDKDRASCNTRGVVERFPGIIYTSPLLSAIASPGALPVGGGGTPDQNEFPQGDSGRPGGRDMPGIN